MVNLYNFNLLGLKLLSYFSLGGEGHGQLVVFLTHPLYFSFSIVSGGLLQCVKPCLASKLSI